MAAVMTEFQLTHTHMRALPSEQVMDEQTDSRHTVPTAAPVFCLHSFMRFAFYNKIY